MDASYKIQRGIHVHLIQFFMCPEFWVHINHMVRALRFISHRLLPQYNRATVPGPVWAPMMGPI